ncbi:KpsF/GutQ family sugar-phosphate isomerase [Dissulfurirhabdus thermomarina]|uniref:KpsF/GutQ family sugar-phosphate isomerase n=1 Tax=Dissulfurirhabdus thermomarina TaxID=1765737 RepID=A0A6N9TLY2_DISTH|nr:KpsF/GutQ family sugar-phosphate isomerase [Dissulfurirhabdus thermomarina]NDY42048.1 KpsF/GutQ family sugar-phosphate isomerase [Dissulfurirhabdus thermomarina]NMX22340.1 KpsF/GutQ family sugar-phosphate isomerase [Dissulfurirhabdus thermomarina]
MTQPPRAIESPEAVLREAAEAIDIEIAGLEKVRGNLGEGFVRAVEILLACQGRVVVTGIGKSGLIGRKIAATLASTGTPALFLHPVEAMHGDLGIVAASDVVIAISNSGETQELNLLLPAFRNRGIPVIALTGRPGSTLGRQSAAVIDTGVEREACALGLAPTASTTAALAVGDALAVVLLRRRHFSEQDFRRNHPSGSLGERLKVEVAQVMLTGEAIPKVPVGTEMASALHEMDRKRLGAVLVVDRDGVLVGIVTDGDLRRALVAGRPLADCRVEEIMTPQPKSVPPYALAADALALMENHLITVLPVLGDNGCLLGIVHLHDLLGKGEFKFAC